MDLLSRARTLGAQGSCLVLGMRLLNGVGVPRDQARGRDVPILLKRLADDHLDRHPAASAGMPRLVHRAHPALTKLADDQVLGVDRLTRGHVRPHHTQRGTAVPGAMINGPPRRRTTVVPALSQSARGLACAQCSQRQRDEAG